MPERGGLTVALDDRTEVLWPASFSRPEVIAVQNYFAASFFAISDVFLPWKRAMASSFSLG